MSALTKALDAYADAVARRKYWQHNGTHGDGQDERALKIEREKRGEVLTAIADATPPALPAALTGYRVSYAAGNGRFSVTNLQTGERRMIGRDFGYSSDNYKRAAVETVHGGPVTYIGEDARGAYFAGL